MLCRPTRSIKPTEPAAPITSVVMAIARNAVTFVEPSEYVSLSSSIAQRNQGTIC